MTAFIKTTKKLMCFGLALIASVSFADRASAQDIYAFSSETGVIYKTTSIGPLVPQVTIPSSWLLSLSNETIPVPDIDITFFNGKLYGVFSAGRNPSISAKLLFLYDPSDTMAGPTWHDVTYSSGDTHYGAAEGLTNDGTSLIVVRGVPVPNNMTGAVSHFIEGIGLNGVLSGNPVDTAPLTTADATNAADWHADVDGLGSIGKCADKLIASDTRPGMGINRTDILSYGTYSSPQPAVTITETDFVGPQRTNAADIDYIDDSEYYVIAGKYDDTVAGSLGLSQFGLHFFTATGGYISSQYVPSDLGIRAVAVDHGCGIKGEHFQCYNARGEVPQHGGLRFWDQFSNSLSVIGSVSARLGKPALHCNPSGKKHGDQTFEIRDERRHLTCYSIDLQSQPAPHKVIRITNQFGTQELTTAERVMFCAPAGKSHDDRIPPIPEKDDHFQCYKVQGDAISSDQITIFDQFGDDFGVLGRPVLHCNPSGKLHNRDQYEIINEERHLVCYEFRDRSPTQFDLTINNQFGVQRIRTDKMLMFCVPSTKKVIR